MQIELADPRDYERLGDIAVDAYLAVPGMATHADHVDELRNLEARARSNTIFAAKVDDTPAGSVIYVPGPASPLAEFGDPTASGIRALSVDPAFQGMGIGRALTIRCVDEARAHRRSRVILHTTRELVAAHRLYRSMGFERDADLDFTNDGTLLSAYIYPLG